MKKPAASDITSVLIICAEVAFVALALLIALDAQSTVQRALQSMTLL